MMRIKTKQERSSSRVIQVVEELCKCVKCQTMLTQKEYLHITSMVLSEADPGSLHHLSCRSLQQIIHGFQMLAIVTKGSILDVRVLSFNVRKELLRGLI